MFIDSLESTGRFGSACSLLHVQCIYFLASPAAGVRRTALYSYEMDGAKPPALPTFRRKSNLLESLAELSSGGSLAMPNVPSQQSNESEYGSTLK